MNFSSSDETGLIRLIEFLKSHNSEYLSGQDLSDVLKISRVAVWKNIKKIKDLGYRIDSKQKLGYRLESISEKLLPWEITSGLTTKFLGKKAYYFHSLDSTQNYASQIASDPLNNGAIIISEKQTNGKGRLGRKWISPKGGIWFSIILQPKFEISVITLFPLASALALSNAVDQSLKIKTEVKWPNDITIGCKKVAGILVEASLESNKIGTIVLGIGINYDIDVNQVEKVIKNTQNFYGVTSLNLHSNIKDRVSFIQNFLVELEKIYLQFEGKNTKKIIKNWTRKSSTIGQDVEIKTEEGVIKGKAIKIDDDGALVISINSKTKRVIAGDVKYLID